MHDRTLRYSVVRGWFECAPGGLCFISVNNNLHWVGWDDCVESDYALVVILKKLHGDSGLYELVMGRPIHVSSTHRRYCIGITTIDFEWRGVTLL